MKRKPGESDLRRAKDNLHRVVTDQQRKLGVPDPGGHVVDAFVNPILEKVARQESKDPAPAREKPNLEDVEVTEIGTYDWHLNTGELRAHPGAWTPQRAQTPKERLQSFVRFLMSKPDVAPSLIAIGRMCSKHTLFRKHCTPCERREAKFAQVLRQCAVKFGYGEVPRKIIVT